MPPTPATVEAAAAPYKSAAGHRQDRAFRAASLAAAGAFRQANLLGLSDAETMPLYDAAYNQAYDAEMGKPLTDSMHHA